MTGPAPAEPAPSPPGAAPADPPHPHTRAGWRRPWLLLTATFLFSRVAVAIAGVRFDMSPLRGGWALDPWQLLDPTLLHHHLAVSVWHLNSQPPLFNVFCGILLKLPYASQEPVAVVTFLGLGLAMVLSLYATMRELRVPTWLASAITVVVIADPAYLLYENWLSYAYPTAAFLSLAAWCSIRYFRTRRRGWGLGFFSAVAVVVLLNSTYQVVWMAGALAVALVALRTQWRSVLVVAALPLLLVGGWVAKDGVQVGTVTTSTWLGMNLTRTTLDTATPAQIHQMVRRHILTPIAEVPAFSSVSAYVPRFAETVHTGVAAVDAPYKADQGTNFNNGVYAGVSMQYLHDDLAFIRARPGVYVRTVIGAAEQWTAPSDEYDFVRINRARIGTWADLFDRTVLVRPAADPSAIVGTTTSHRGPAVAQLSFVTIVISLGAVLGSPFVVWCRRRREAAVAATLAFLWLTTTYALTVTSLLEFGENQRFAMELGPLPVVAFAVVASTLLRTRDPEAGVRSGSSVTSSPVGRSGSRRSVCRIGRHPRSNACRSIRTPAGRGGTSGSAAG